MAVIDDLLSWGGRTFERQFFILVDPVPRNGDRRDVSVTGERADLADYEILWNGRNPDSSWALDIGVVWSGWGGNPNPANEVRVSRP